MFSKIIKIFRLHNITIVLVNSYDNKYLTQLTSINSCQRFNFFKEQYQDCDFKVDRGRLFK